MRCGSAAAFLSYASMRSSGFRVTPFAANKTPKYAGLAFIYFLGWNYGSVYVKYKLGDKAYHNYLCRNADAIMAGDKPMQ